ncbi:MAG: S1C family serine protease [Pseudonocardiaceae bacterium]
MTDETSRSPLPGDRPGPDSGPTGDERPDQPQSSWSEDTEPGTSRYQGQPYGAHQPGYPYSPPQQPGWQQQTSTLPRAEKPRRTGALIVVVALLVGLLAGGVGGVVGYTIADRGGTGPVSALDERAPDARQTANFPDGSVEQVAQQVLPSVVQVQVSDSQIEGEGSGVVLSSDGLILTNNHVVEAAANGGQITAVFQDGRQAPVRIVGRAPSFDLAVVRAEGVSNVQPAELGQSDDLVVGQQVIAFGSPLGLSGTVTTGIVSALDRPVRAGGEGSGQNTVLNAVQTDAAINPGNSGGPLADMQGRVVGLNSAIASTGVRGQAGSIGLGFAIPIDQATRVADELVTEGVATQALLGVETPVGGAGPTTGGAAVSEVTPGGAAAAAGIRPGEVIAKVDDRLIESGDALVATIRSYPPGSPITMTVSGEGGATRTVQVTLGSQQVPPGN